MSTSRKKKLDELTKKSPIGEVSQELKPFILEAAREYLNNAHQDKVNGWDKYWCYARPTNKYIGTLTKITFEIGKKELDKDQLLSAIKLEIEKRILSGDSYFLSGFRAFSTNEMFYRQEMSRDHILNNVLDSDELLSQLEQCAEFPKITELYQRIKDYRHEQLAHDALIDEIYKYRKQ